MRRNSLTFTPANAAPNFEGEPPELPERGPAPRRRRPDLFPWLPKFPPLTQQCACEADAVHRPGWFENPNLPGAIVPPNGWPAMATLDLPSGNYVVTAKAQVTNLSAKDLELSATLRKVGARRSARSSTVRGCGSRRNGSRARWGSCRCTALLRSARSTAACSCTSGTRVRATISSLRTSGCLRSRSVLRTCRRSDS